MRYQIKNWDEFQHFKDRNPPWIKLYKTLLERRDIAMISDCNFRILIGLWLLASEDEKREGFLPEIADIAFRLRKTEAEISTAFQELNAFIIEHDDTLISPRYQDDIKPISLTRSQETETEAETKTEEEAETPPPIFSEKELTQFRKQCPSLTEQEFINQVTNCEIWINAHGSKTPELTLSKWLQRAEQEKPKIPLAPDGLNQMREMMGGTL